MQQTPNPSLVTERPLEPAAPVATEATQVAVTRKPVEIGGPPGPEPTRYGDWERNGHCVDF
jgi:hypothetical protein